jgi:PKD repeat protein
MHYKNKSSSWLSRLIVLCALLYSGGISAQALSGTYTIDPSGSGTNNFTTFAAANNSLAIYGVAGPVLFKVANGTYSEQVVVPYVSGTNANNTITFDGGDAKKTIIAPVPNSGNFSAFKISNTSWVTVRNMTFAPTGSYQWGFQIASVGSGYGSNIKVIKCNILVDSSNYGSTNYIPVVTNDGGTGWTNSGQSINLSFDSCYISGGYAAISFNASNNPAYGYMVNHSTVKNFVQYGIWENSIGELKVMNSYIASHKSSTYAIGLFYLNGNANTAGHYHEIANNVLNCSEVAIELLTASGKANEYNLCYNNMMYGLKYNYNQNGIYDNYCQYWKMYHNTVYQDQPTIGAYPNYNPPPSGIGVNVPSSSYLTDIRNNIMIVANTTTPTTALPGFFTGAGLGISKLDYNNYYNGYDTTKLLYLDAFLGPGNYKGYQGYNLHSTNYPINFVSPTNLHLGTGNPPLLGDSTVGVLKDIDGDVRCHLGPTPGADELIIKNPTIIANLSGPDTVSIGNPVKFTSNSSAPVGFVVKWFIHGVQVNSGGTFNAIYNTPGPDSINITVATCYGTKSTSKKIFVISPRNIPKADFVSDVNSVYTGSTVNFSDASGNAPSAWNWTVTPATYNDPVNGVVATFKFAPGSTAASQNPTILFNVKGNYTVCLEASNAKGVNKLCKQNYIHVLDGFNMCGSTTRITNTSGFLFDDGGPTGNYSYNHTGTGTCKMLLAPCNATKVTLSFRNFSLNAGDYLRIYDGSDASGIPIWNH